MGAKPYVGITGPVTTQEVELILNEFNIAGYTMGSAHVPMLGYLVSFKTLNGQPTLNRRYPSIIALQGLIQRAAGKVLTMVHYNSREISTLTDQVCRIFDGVYQEGLCRAVQLNIVWPDATQVKRIKEKFPELQIVFQASHKAMEGKSPAQICEGIREYGDAISYALIDPSGGRGLEFDINSSLVVYQELRETTPAITVGFAGGLTGANVEERVKSILSRTGSPDFCIDAECGLRDKLSDAYGDDSLNIQKVKAYLQAASSVLR
jgi:phosphoribosylanthranilate isomerase